LLRGRAIIRRLPTAVALVRSQDRSCGIRGGQCGTGAGSLRVLRFPLPILIPPTVPQLLINLSLTSYSLNTDSVVKNQLHIILLQAESDRKRLALKVYK
jgi:hypothetical protein